MPCPATRCQHRTLTTVPSPHAATTAYTRPPPAKCIAAAQPSGRPPLTAREPPASTFPAPLVMPGDALADDPHAPPQSVLSWRRERDRNAVTPERRTVYVVSPPRIGEDAYFLGAAMQPRRRHRARGPAVAMPSALDVAAYLRAFYAPLPVRVLDSFEYADAPADGTPRGQPPVTLRDDATDTRMRIATRAGPADSPFAHQLSCIDLVDGLAAALPRDAYAAVLLVEHDMWEDEGDTFCVGRAFGADRVAVVSVAQYSPALDAFHGVDAAHAWPASHCVDFVCALSGVAETARPEEQGVEPSSPMRAALDAYKVESVEPDARRAWLNRVCRTVSHELGHCFGIDHCVYNACIMQATSSVAEDVRQPGYLCPVDMAKVLRATGAGEVQWCEGMAEACGRLGPGGGFGALGAWCEARKTSLLIG